MTETPMLVKNLPEKEKYTYYYDGLWWDYIPAIFDNKRVKFCHPGQYRAWIEFRGD